MILGSSGADDIVEDHGDANWATLIAIDKYNWSPVETSPQHNWAHWTANYVGIQRANLVLEKLPSLEGLDGTLKKRYIAEVKTLRAFYYYNLVTAYGDVPLILTNVGYNGAVGLERAPEDQVWNQIIKDLTEAGSDLPDVYGSPEDHARVTKGMTNALMAEAYLWKKDWANAASTAKKVIDSPAGYKLEANYADLFNGVAEFSDEAIFTASRAAGAEKQSIWSDYIDETNYVVLWGPFQPWSWFYQPDTNFVRHNTYIDATDIRIDTMTLDGNSEVYDLNNDGVIDPAGDDLIPTAPPGNIHLMKWIPYGVDLKDGVIWSGGLGQVDQQLIRLAEVYLDYAEALVQQGNGAEALTYINMIRARAEASDIVTTDQNELLAIILNERKVEFCFEGKRYFDLKRAGKLQEFLGPLGWKSHMDRYPIPQEEIDLTNMSQNPGY